MSDIERTQGQGERDELAVPQYHTERKRTRVRQHRSKLAVHGKDPNFEYRWVIDSKDSGAIIKMRINEDWVLVHADEISDVGEDSVFKSEFAGGSIVRIPANSDGVFYYLMKIKKEWYDADQKTKADEIDAREDAVMGRNVGEGLDDEDTYDAIAGVRGNNKPSRITGVDRGGRPQ